ncbi:MAG: hypothetical protein IE933_00465 [Sphingomonadales bacterium]|nr:hypothetical protein [Sphingomonadales bacterium]MBD3773238.1 hypothetical protein [Paracoccaceae bacterium]
MTESSFPHDGGQMAETAPDGVLVMHPDRPRMKLRPLKAWHHFRELVKDKENTEEVFRIFESLPSRDLETRARNFVLSEAGERIRASEAYLPDILDDHAALRLLPEDSVAHAYLDFMESQGLTAAGLVAEYDKFIGDRPDYGDLFGWYLNRYRDTHDLLHVLTGYSRDALGEQCVLAFTHGQNGGMGNLFIAYAGALHMRNNGARGAPVVAAVREAQKQGKACPRIADMPIRELLARPLAEVRREFAITPPRLYQQCHDQWRAMGIDPFDLLAPAAAEPLAA